MLEIRQRIGIRGIKETAVNGPREDERTDDTPDLYWGDEKTREG